MNCSGDSLINILFLLAIVILELFICCSAIEIQKNPFIFARDLHVVRVLNQNTRNALNYAQTREFNIIAQSKMTLD